MASYQTHENTRDIPVHDRPKTAPPTPKSSRRTTRFGRICFTAGTTTAVALCLVSLAVAVASNNNAWKNNTSELFAALAFFGAMTICCALIGVGGREHIIHKAHAETRDQMRAEIAEAVQREFLQAHPGMQTLRNDIGEIHDALAVFAEHLPDALKQQNWQGFNDAVKQGFIQPTGTDPAAGRSTRLGLVRPPRPNGR